MSTFKSYHPLRDNAPYIERTTIRARELLINALALRRPLSSYNTDKNIWKKSWVLEVAYKKVLVRIMEDSGFPQKEGITRPL